MDMDGASDGGAVKFHYSVNVNMLSSRHYEGGTTEAIPIASTLSQCLLFLSINFISLRLFIPFIIE